MTIPGEKVYLASPYLSLEYDLGSGRACLFSVPSRPGLQHHGGLRRQHYLCSTTEGSYATAGTPHDPGASECLQRRRVAARRQPRRAGARQRTAGAGGPCREVALAPRARHASTTAIGGLHQHGKRPEVAVGDDPGGVAYARLALFRGRLEYHRMSHGGLHYSPCVSMPAPL
jgi:hypothetical protein